MTLYCGIDLHSNNCVVSIIDDADRVKYEKRLPNELGAVVLALSAYRDELAGVVVESTYNWYWLVDGLMAAGFDVHLANTVAMKQYSGLKYTDDKTDARYLAHLLRLGILPEGYIYPVAGRCVRDLLRRRLLLVRQRVTQHLSLQSLIARHTGKQLSGPQVSQLKRERINELLVDEATRLSAYIAHELMDAMSAHITHIERHVGPLCQRTRAYELVTSTPGIGPILGQSIVLETGPIERFNTASHYASYARCVPSQRLSNGKKKGEGNRNNGNTYLAYAFVEAAHHAAIRSPSIKRYYQRKAARTHIMVAKKAVANKLARACYQMLTHDQPFDVSRAFG